MYSEHGKLNLTILPFRQRPLNNACKVLNSGCVWHPRINIKGKSIGLQLKVFASYMQHVRCNTIIPFNVRRTIFYCTVNTTLKSPQLVACRNTIILFTVRRTIFYCTVNTTLLYNTYLRYDGRYFIYNARCK